jgi:hypothetical protein
MLSLSFASHHHRRHASIIPISSILQTCHLIPCFGRASVYNLGWTSEAIYNDSPTFYLNLYLRHRDFYLLRYLIDKHTAELQKRAEKREEARTRDIYLTYGHSGNQRTK